MTEEHHGYSYVCRKFTSAIASLELSIPMEVHWMCVQLLQLAHRVQALDGGGVGGRYQTAPCARGMIALQAVSQRLLYCSRCASTMRSVSGINGEL